MTVRNQFLGKVNMAMEAGAFTDVIALLNEDPEKVLIPGDFEWYQSRIYLAEGQLEIAEQTAIDGLRKAPASYGLYRALGEIIGEQGEIEAAKECLRGSRLERYINQKYFAAESQRLAMANEQQESIYHHRLYEEPRKELSPVVRVGAGPLRPEFNSDELYPSAPSVVVIENGKVWFDGHSLCVYDQNDVLLRGCALGNPLLVESIRHHSTPVRLEGVLGVVAARSWNNYFHWTTDVTPGFHLLDKASEAHGDADHYLVSHSGKAFQTDFMQMAGVDMQRVYSQASPEGFYYTADKLIVPVFKHRMGMGMGRWAVEYLRNLSVSSDTRAADRRIYISRRDVKSRGVENENELIEFLAEYGFEDVTLDGMSLKQQMELFSQSEFIFAPHGAGLTNIVYCQPGATVVEFFADFVQPCFRALAHLSKLPYGHFSTVETEQGLGALEASKRKHVIQHQNYRVNLDAAAAMLENFDLARVRLTA